MSIHREVEALEMQNYQQEQKIEELEARIQELSPAADEADACQKELYAAQGRIQKLEARVHYLEFERKAIKNLRIASEEIDEA